MIRLDIKPNCTRYFSNHLKCLLRLEPWLRELGIEFASPGDIMLIQNCGDKDYVRHLLDRNQPTILQDTYLGPEIFFWGLREFIKRDNVKVVLKTSKFTDPKDYDKQFYCHMRHVAIIAGREATSPYGQKIHPFCSKIVVFANLVAWDHFQIEYPCLEKFRLNRPKQYDISMVIGDINECYPRAETRTHRRTAVSAMHNLRDKYKIYLRIPSHDPILSRDNYNEVMLDSMACLSPWGYDVTCFRDFEAALYGAVLIRPDASWATSWPEIPYIVCRTDFADLEEIVEDIKSRYRDYDEMRVLARQNALKGRENVGLAKRLADIIKTCLGWE